MLLFIAGAVYGQDTINISITGRNMPISGFIRQLESKTGFSFIYGKAAFDDQERVSLTLSNVGLSEALSALFKGKNLSWQYREKTVILSRQAPQNSQVTADSAPQYSVAGTVVDPQGNPIEGASVALRGQSRGQGTNSKGEFSFSGIPENAVLVVSSIGYATKQLRLSGQQEVRVALDTLVHEIEGVEVVSTGYQDIPKERATGSFYKLDNELLNRSVSTNILDRLIGVTSGLNFEPRSRNRGNSVMIRGISTINANPRPLIVVDGFPYDESNANQNLINNINPNDIESVTVLKDAAAASIWGTRAGNGVIVISTKKGRYNQNANIQFNSNISISDEPNLSYLPRIPTANIVTLERELFASGYFDADLSNAFTFPRVSPVVEILEQEKKGEISSIEANLKINELTNYDVKNDIKKYLIRNGLNQQYAINLSGGSSTFNYYGSVGVDKILSTSKRDKSNRMTFRIGNTYRPFNNLEITSLISYTENRNENNSLGYESFLNDAPYSRLANDQGHALPTRSQYREAYTDTAKLPALLDWKYRALDELLNNNKISKQFDIRVGTGLKYKIINGLDIEMKYLYQKTLTNSEQLYNESTYLVRNLVNQYMYVTNSGSIAYPIPNLSILDYGNIEMSQWNIRGQLNYNNSWRKHQITALLGTDARELTSINRSSRVYGYDPQTGTTHNNIDYESLFVLRPAGNSATIPNTGRIGGNNYRYLSYFGNASYTFNEKYIVSVSSRLDGSNFYGVKANQKIVPLWSSGISWNISDENFFTLDWLPYVKLRATYGYNGNTDNSASAYPTISYLSINRTNPGLANAQIISPGNPTLRWEKIRMINIGFDFSGKNNVISGSLEYYHKKGIDLIGPIQIDPTSGRTSYIGNRANIKGNGIDLILETKNIRSELNWITNLLLSYNTDEVTAYEGISTADSYIQGAAVVGSPLYSIYSYTWGGLNPSTGDPRGYVNKQIVDYNTVTTSSKPEDLTYGGRMLPSFFGSLRNTLIFNSLELSFNIIYKFGYSFRRSSISYGSLFRNQNGHSDYLKRWIKPGDENHSTIPSTPSVVSSSRDNAYAYSSILVDRGDHIRLQDIRLSYYLKIRRPTRMSFNGIRLYMYLNNMGILWKANKHNIDPDYGDQVIPPSRSIAFGLSTSF